MIIFYSTSIFILPRLVSAAAEASCRATCALFLVFAFTLLFTFVKKSMCFYFFQDVQMKSQSAPKLSSDPYCHQ